ncbi:MAG: 4Fe-4S binding protein [Armatimonadetes bacterium]|nr:4Fe-4S binding protein [Armatimonadota bacterium]
MTAPEPARTKPIKITRPPKPKWWRIQNIRRMAQAAFFLLFLGLLAQTALPLRPLLPVDLFFRADPLVFLTAGLASRAVTPSMVVFSVGVLVITVLLGRFFCGWVCPMGTAVDLSDRFLFRVRKNRDLSPYRNLKYYILASLLVSALFSAQPTYFFDPLSLITRTLVWVAVSPLWIMGRWLGGQELVYRLAPSLAQTPLIPQIQPYFRAHWLAALIFAAVLALGYASRRFWCRNLCPLGALLALLSRWGLVRRQVKDDACLECRRCDRECKMGAIQPDPRRTQATECIECYNCVPLCGPRSTALPLALSRAGFDTGVDVKRRRLLGAAGIGALWAGLVNGDLGAKRSGNSEIRSLSPALIRPPGSLAEAPFLDRCTRCALCMKACPTGGLQPALAEAGLEGFWTPVLVPHIGYCAQHCNLCGEVCPTDAIQPFTPEEKSHLYIGRAVIDRSDCLVWAQGKECLVCDEHCSYRAIAWEEGEDGSRRPLVRSHLCTGCGECENKCPVQPRAAIRVISFGDRRHLSREAQARLRQDPQGT